MVNPTPESLMCPLSPAGMEAVFEAAVRRYCDGLRDLHAALAAMGRTFVLQYPPVADLRRFADDCRGADAETEAGVRRVFRLWAWRALSRMTNLTLLMTAAENRRLEEQLRDPDLLPEVSAANIAAWADGLVARIPELSRDAVAEAWRILTPARSDHKTNQRNEGIGRKVILSWWFHRYANCATLHEGSGLAEEAQAVDKAFHLLDGKGLPKYPGDLLTALRQGLARSQGNGFTGESEYTRFKVFGNGNVHLEMKRPDLVAEINRACGGNMVTQTAAD